MTTEYITLQYDDAAELEMRVNEHIKDGWYPLGFRSVSLVAQRGQKITRRFTQTLFRRHG